jgi:hypothetical protein
MKKVKKVVVDKYEKVLEKGVEIASQYLKAKIAAEELDKIVKRFLALGVLGIAVIGAAIYFGLKHS